MSHIIVCGINHHGSPVEVRERVAMPQSCLSYALEHLKKMPGIQEAVILSTCNRLEVYAVVECVDEGLDQLSAFFRHARSIEGHEALKPNLRLLRDDAVLQLFRVASGLDSLVIGEGQILAQVKQAISAAAAAGSSGPILRRLFDMAIRCGKRVRSELALSQKAVSVSSAAVELATQQLGALRGKKALVIGSGAMGRLCLKQLGGKNGVQGLTVFNRAGASMDACREEFPQVNTCDEQLQLPSLISQSDVVIVATNAPGYMVTPDMLSYETHKIVIDISVPRCVDPSVADIPGTTLKNIDDLQEVIKQNLAERQKLAEKAEPILIEALDEFGQWVSSYQLAAAVTTFREQVKAIGSKYFDETGTGTAADATAARMLDEILHTPTVRLKQSGKPEYAKVLFELFGLDDPPVKAI